MISVEPTILITSGTTLVGLGVVWGSISSKVNSLRDQVKEQSDAIKSINGTIHNGLSEKVTKIHTVVERLPCNAGPCARPNESKEEN